MKVLYIGNYLDGTGWARAATDMILALDSVGVDVVPRPIRMNGVPPFPIPQRLAELESKSSESCDVVVQHVLPHMMEYSGEFRHNVGIFASETSHFKNSVWPDRLNCMDTIVVANEQMRSACVNSGVCKPVKIVGHASDMARFQKSYPPLQSLKKYKEDGQFLFYYVGECVERKNLKGLLRAFYAEFEPNEPVKLVIKTSKPGMSSDECEEYVRTLCDEVRRNLKLNKLNTDWTPEIILTERLTDEGMMRLHSTCDSFVMVSRGEAWNQPAFDAMAMGKTPIISDNTGHCQYMSESSGWMVGCLPTPIYGETETFEDIYTGEELWWEPDLWELQQCLREAYSSSGTRKKKAESGMEGAYSFSYEAVGLAMEEAIRP